jgi:hypothetical protein
MNKKLSVGTKIKLTEDLVVYNAETFERIVAIPKDSVCEVIAIDVHIVKEVTLATIHVKSGDMVGKFYTEHFKNSFEVI